MKHKAKKDGALWQGRWLLAVITTILTTSIGLVSLSKADAAEPCGLKDVKAYQAEITHPQEEADPGYYWRTSEKFIAACPDRIERRDAHMIAARGKLDSGEGLAAAQHYDSAIARGAQLTPMQLMDYAIALRSIGSGGRARAIQESAISAWVSDVTRTGLGALQLTEVASGKIIEVTFDAIDPEEQISAIWLASPETDGLPAAVVVRPNMQMAAWRAIRTGQFEGPLMVAELHQCRATTIIDETTGVLSLDQTREMAFSVLREYMRYPDVYEETAPGQPLASCMTLPAIFHVPNPRTAIPSNF